VGAILPLPKQQFCTSSFE